MSAWTERIRTHPVWQRFDEIKSALGAGLARPGLSAGAIESLNRISTIGAFVQKRLSAGDLVLMHPGPLDNLGSALQSMLGEVQNFVSNGNEGHLSNANSHADAALSHLTQVIIPSSAKDASALKTEVEAYRKALETNLKGVQETMGAFTVDAGNLKQRLDALAGEISTEREALQGIASQQQGQFSSAQEGRNREHQEALSSRQREFDEMLGALKGVLESHGKAFVAQRDALEHAQKEELAALTKTYKDDAAKLLADIQKHRQQVERLVGVIGNLGVTSGYQKAANEARWTARVWQGIAVVSLGAIIVVAYKAFLPLVQGSFTWEGFAGRVFVSLTVGVLAAYAISQADKYQQVERRSRKLALELEALGPFVASLPIDKQEEFRLRVGDRTFGTSPDMVDGDSVNSPRSVVDVALKSKDLQALVVEVIKAVRNGA
jgi:hypothetical protein